MATETEEKPKTILEDLAEEAAKDTDPESLKKAYIKKIEESKKRFDADFNNCECVRNHAPHCLGQRERWGRLSSIIAKMGSLASNVLDVEHVVTQATLNMFLPMMKFVNGDPTHQASMTSWLCENLLHLDAGHGDMERDLQLSADCILMIDTGVTIPPFQDLWPLITHDPAKFAELPKNFLEASQPLREDFYKKVSEVYKSLSKADNARKYVYPIAAQEARLINMPIDHFFRFAMELVRIAHKKKHLFQFNDQAHIPETLTSIVIAFTFTDDLNAAQKRSHWYWLLVSAALEIVPTCYRRTQFVVDIFLLNAVVQRYVISAEIPNTVPQFTTQAIDDIIAQGKIHKQRLEAVYAEEKKRAQKREKRIEKRLAKKSEAQSETLEQVASESEEETGDAV